MYISKYTLLFNIDSKEFYTYNTLSNALIEIDEDSFTLILQLKNGERISEDKFDKELWDTLCENIIDPEGYAYNFEK